MLQPNIILATDAYKLSHWLQLPEGIQNLHGYIEARKKNALLMFNGLQGYIGDYLTHPFTQADIDEAEDITTGLNMPFNKKGWQQILNIYGGFLPIKIVAALEGSIIPSQHTMVYVEAIDDRFHWLESYIETSILRATWYPCTVGINSYNTKQLIKSFMEISCDNLDKLPYMLHDFGARGVSSGESAMIGGAAHLVNFQGSDNLEAIRWIRYHYGCQHPAATIPASEHTTVITWGRDGEQKQIQHMIDTFGKSGAVFANVSDTYDLWNVLKNLYGDTFKEQLINGGFTLVVRPDSGKLPYTPIETTRILADKFGTITNTKGYEVLPPCIKVIQGDGIDKEGKTIEGVLRGLHGLKLSADNICFGQGGGLLQDVTRDDYGFAMKPSAMLKNDEWIDIYKDPITDNGKRSKRGRQMLWHDPRTNHYITKPFQETMTSSDYVPALHEIWNTGEFKLKHTFGEIRERQI